jgi:hypothetical protein
MMAARQHLPNRRRSIAFTFEFESHRYRATASHFDDGRLAEQVPLHLVTPGKWKKHFQLTSDKEQSRELAIRLFPGSAFQFNRKKHHGRAEAALLARYGAETIGGAA